jgi:hypothetical protein
MACGNPAWRQQIWAASLGGGFAGIKWPHDGVLGCVAVSDHRLLVVSIADQERTQQLIPEHSIQHRDMMTSTILLGLSCLGLALADGTNDIMAMRKGNLRRQLKDDSANVVTVLSAGGLAMASLTTRNSWHEEGVNYVHLRVFFDNKDAKNRDICGITFRCVSLEAVGFLLVSPFFNENINPPLRFMWKPCLRLTRCLWSLSLTALRASTRATLARSLATSRCYQTGG